MARDNPFLRIRRLRGERLEAAWEFLYEFLGDGYEHRVKDIMEAGRKRGLYEKLIYRARDVLRRSDELQESMASHRKRYWFLVQPYTERWMRERDREEVRKTLEQDSVERVVGARRPILDFQI